MTRRRSQAILPLSAWVVAVGLTVSAGIARAAGTWSALTPQEPGHVFMPRGLAVDAAGNL